jgi:hypothetical protein
MKQRKLPLIINFIIYRNSHSKALSSRDLQPATITYCATRGRKSSEFRDSSSFDLSSSYSIVRPNKGKPQIASVALEGKEVIKRSSS